MSLIKGNPTKFFLALALALATPFAASAAGARAPASKWSHLDPKKEVPAVALSKALAWYDANEAKVQNKSYLSVVDFSKHSGRDRFYVINLKSGAVEALHTAHGAGSDPNRDGYADRFSNTPGSGMSSLGAFLTGEMYWDDGENRWSLFIDGKENSNSNARDRWVVVHPATYVRENSSSTGLSLGCPALDPSVADRVMRQIAGKSVFFAWHPEYN